MLSLSPALEPQSRKSIRPGLNHLVLQFQNTRCSLLEIRIVFEHPFHQAVNFRIPKDLPPSVFRYNSRSILGPILKPLWLGKLEIRLFEVRSHLYAPTRHKKEEHDRKEKTEAAVHYAPSSLFTFSPVKVN